jgi:tripartite-type tricarboxylate transporter receptor subunit TctC
VPAKPARTLIVPLVVLAVAAGTVDARADDYPSRPVHIVVPYAAGGGTDAMARFIARGLEKKLGQPVIIDNRPGQGTAVGGTYVARAAPDGYTLLMATSSTLAMNPTIYPKLAYDPPRDFTPVALVAAVPFVLIVHPSLGVTTLDGLVRLARAKPGALSYGSGGAGSAHHVFMELVRSMTGVDIKHVPYRGGGPALTDVVAGHVPMMFADVGQALQLVRGGQVRALGVTTARRVETMPEVLTLAQAGLAGYEANTWQCVVAPARLPAPIVAKLNHALVEVMVDPATRSHFLDLGMQPLTSTPAELGDYIKSEMARWGLVLRTAGAVEE